MSQSDPPRNPPDDPQPMTPFQKIPFRWTDLWKRLAVWAAFFALLYLVRDFIFVAFMTFLISYLALNVVDFTLRSVSPRRERPWLRRLLTIAVFVLAPILLLAVGVLVLPPIIAQGQRLAGWLIHVTPEAEVSRLLEQYVGPAEFRRQYGGPDDPRYQKALEDFRKTGESHVADYIEFPKFEAWVEGGFQKSFDDKERARVRSHLLSDGTNSKDFENWFLNRKLPRALSKSSVDDSSARDPCLPISPSETPAQVLQRVRRDPSVMASLQSQWIEDSEAEALALAKGSAAREEQFHAYYDALRADSPQAVPYTYSQFTQLQSTRSQGRRPFGDTVEKLFPLRDGDQQSRLRADFEAAATHDAFKTWWSTSSPAQFIRKKIGSDLSLTGLTADWIERVLAWLFKFPVDLGTALLLSFLICIDFPRVSRACRGLRETWLKDVYDELAPALSRLAFLIGRAMQAQGLIAFANSSVMFLALWFLGVEHALLLSATMFVLCLVPTIGTLLAWLLIASVALVQPGGGLGLAAKVTAAVFLVVALEVFIFSPRILGKIMELHPLLIVAILPIAQYFFGIWGLILATPVAVFVINFVIFGDRTDDQTK